MDRLEVNMRLELKKAIIDWLYENEHRWQRVRACTDAFWQYISDENGDYIIGGEDVNVFIHIADDMLFRY